MCEEYIKSALKANVENIYTFISQFIVLYLLINWMPSIIKNKKK